MPQFDPRFVMMAPLQQVIHDKLDGSLLAGGVVTFYSDNNNTMKKAIYKLTLNPNNQYEYIELNNPLTLSSIGSFVDDDGNNYIPLLFPYDGDPSNSHNTVELYYITVVSASAQPQFTVEHWPQSLSISDGNGDSSGDENQLSNPQFVEVLFQPDLATGVHRYTVSGTNAVTPVAPGWDLVTTGSGNVDVKWIEVVQTDAPSNPPYALDIQGGGALTVLQLRQRLVNSPRLFAGGFVSGSFVINSQDGSDHLVTLSYIPNNGSSHTIVSGMTGTAISFSTLDGTTIIDGSINITPASTGYVDIVFDIPNTLAHFQVSSFQVVATDTITETQGFIELSTARQIDHLFNYYKPELEFKPIPSLLTGWDFPLNPAQNGTALTITNAVAYTWDQTIAAGGSTNFNVVRNTVTGGFQATSAGSASAFYLQQYLTGAQAKKMLGTPLSVNVSAVCSNGGVVNTKIYLYRAASGTAIPVLGAPFGTLSTNGVFTLTLANGWTEIPRGDQGLATADVHPLSSDLDLLTSDYDYGFSGWEITNLTQIQDTDKFAIVVTFSAAATSTVIIINSISVVPGLIPTRPAPQTVDEVLRECQYYYEKSYEVGTAPGAVDTVGERFANIRIVLNIGVNDSFYAQSFGFVFNTYKLKPPTLTFYSPATGAIDRLLGIVTRNNAFFFPQGYVDLDIATWLETGKSTSSVWMASTNTSVPLTVVPFSQLQDEGYVLYHYVADARLGVV